MLLAECFGIWIARIGIDAGVHQYEATPADVFHQVLPGVPALGWPEILAKQKRIFDHLAKALDIRGIPRGIDVQRRLLTKELHELRIAPGMPHPNWALRLQSRPPHAVTAQFV